MESIALETKCGWTTHIWQNWKKNYSCYATAIYRDEAATILWKLQFEDVKFGVFLEKSIFCQYLLNLSSNLRIILHTRYSYNCSYILHSKFCFNRVKFFPFPICVFSAKSPNITQRLVSQETAFKKSKHPPFLHKTMGSNNSFTLIESNLRFLRLSLVWIQCYSTLWPMGKMQPVVMP